MNLRPLARWTASAALLATTLLTGCTTLQQVHDTNQSVIASEQKARELLREREAQQARAKTPVVQIIHGTTWLPTQTVARAASIPQALRCQFEYAPKRPVPLALVADRVTDICHVAVRITTDAEQALHPHASTAGGNMPSAAPQNFPPGFVPPPLSSGGGTSFAAPQQPASRTDRINVTYAGPLDGFLNTITGQLGLSWRYDARNGVVTIFYTETRTFTIDAIPTENGIDTSVTSGTTTTAGVSSGGTGGGTSGGGSTGGISGSSQSQSTTSMNLSSNVLSDLKAAVKSMLTPRIGRMAISASTGTITVTDTPSVLSRVAAYIKVQNAALTRQVQLNIRVIAVTITSNNSMGLNWNALYTTLANKFDVNLVSAYQTPSGSTTGSYNVLQSGSHWSGSSAVVSALAEQGRIATLYDAPITTLNLTPYPIQVAKQTTYLASASLSQTAQVGTTNSLMPGNVTTGFNMSVLPYILPNNRTVLLQFTLNLSSLESLPQVGTATNFIQTPQTDDSIIEQKVKLEYGQTLVMTGYQANGLNGTKQGVGDPNNFLLGGGAGTNNRRQIIVVIVTPIVMR